MDFNSLLRRAANTLVRSAIDAASSALKKKFSGSASGSRSASGSKGMTAKPKASAKAETTVVGSDYTRGSGPNGYPLPSETPVLWSVESRGLPDFEYRPEKDGAPDPGEVVWTWVPYEENDGRGKDRPVLIVAMDGDYVVFAQLTSKNHAKGRAYQDEYGEWWMDIGTGSWDPMRRPSEVKLSKLWVVHTDQIRRGGGALDTATYKTVVDTLKQIYR